MASIRQRTNSNGETKYQVQIRLKGQPAESASFDRLTVKQFAEKHPAFSEASLRYHIFHRHKNGLNSALRKVGRRVLIEESDFFAWVDSQQNIQQA